MNALRLNFVKLYGKKIDNKDVKTSGKKEDLKMVKTLKVEGMMCTHCEARVKKALEAIDGVESAAPDHNKNECVVVLNRDVADEVLKKVVEDQGYTVG